MADDVNNGWTAPRVAAAVAVAAATAIIVWQLHPASLFTGSRPTISDLGGHFHEPLYLRSHLLPHGRISGWSPDWFGGYPSLTFYFPFSSLFVVGLSLLLPYAVAFKLVAASGVASLPVAAYAFGRLSGRSPSHAACMAVATVALLFQSTLLSAGGTVAAAVNGEYAYSIGISVGLVALGYAFRGARTGRHRATVAGLLAVTALIHAVPALVIAGGVGLLVAMAPTWRRAKWATTTLLVGVGLFAFWLVPFLASRHYTSNMHFKRAPVTSGVVFPGSMAVIVVLAIVGLGLSITRRDKLGVFLAGMAALLFLGFALIPGDRIWNGRLLPLFFLFECLLAGSAVGQLAQSADEFRRRAQRASRAAYRPVVQAASPLAVLVVVSAVAISQFGLPTWLTSGRPHPGMADFATSRFGGYDRTPERRQYQQLIDTVARVGQTHGCGRALWEFRDDSRYLVDSGVLMLLPVWTHGCIASMQGLFLESSASSPYVLLTNAALSSRPVKADLQLRYPRLDVPSAVLRLRMLGVRYYIAGSADAQAQADAVPDLRLVGTAPPIGGGTPRTWKVYEVRQSSIVEPLTTAPFVDPHASPSTWEHIAVRWFDDPRSWPAPIAAGGPPSWPRVRGRAPRPPPTFLAAKVTKLVTHDDTIRFHVDRTGTPVVVKMSYFPNWKAKGAAGPWRLTPNEMVVVPTKHDVVLSYGRSRPEVLGALITLVALVGLVGLWRAKPLGLESARWWRLGDDVRAGVAKAAGPASRPQHQRPAKKKKKRSRR